MYRNCSECQKQFLYTTSSSQVSAWNFQLLNYLMNSLSSYCGIGDAKISASDKDLPVKQIKQYCFQLILTNLNVQLTLTF